MMLCIIIESYRLKLVVRELTACLWPPKEIYMKFKSVLKILTSIFFISVFFTACATAPKASEPAVVKDTSGAVVEAVKKEPVKIVTTVYYPVKEESYFGDGAKDEYRVFTYNDDGTLLLKEDLYGSDDKLQESIVSNYFSPESGIKKFYGSDGNLKTYEKIILDSDGNILKNEKYDNKDNLQSISTYEYANGLKTNWKVYGSSNNLLSTTDYKYTGKLLTRIESLSPGGEMEEYFVLKYNSNGLLVENTHFNSVGDVEDSKTFEYKGGFLIMEQQHRKNGSVSRKIMYRNDKNGNHVEIVYMDAGDNVQERLVRTYESREEISYEK